jgi:tRNA modification GTPase
MDTDPIIAVSSPPGRGLRGIIRITGPDLAPLLATTLHPSPSPHILTASRLSLGPAADSPTLPVLALYQPGPRSFTSQDVLEIQCPGNPALLDRLLHTLLGRMRLALGAGRLAEAGEFTQRAFLAGRIDLTRAEGIAATISATADAQLEAARLLRTGELGRWAVSVVDSFSQALALVEASIDFVDQEDVVPIGARELRGRLAEAKGAIEGLVGRSRSWREVEALPWVVLAGPANAGKSTLFNALLGRRRAVVSEVAGTTRDVLTEPMRVGEGEVMLVDVAGLDEAEGWMNEAMQAAARAAMERAEVLIVLGEAGGAAVGSGRSRRVSQRGAELGASRATVIKVAAKADLGGRGASAEGEEAEALAVSAVTGQGMEELRQRIGQAVRDRAVSLSGQMLALTPRHQAELAAALDAVNQAIALLEQQTDRQPARQGESVERVERVELVAAAMRQALDHLGALGGQMTPDDVIGRIFSTFCIGK